MKTILSTKKLSEKLKIKLENEGFLVVEKNFIKIKKVKFKLENIQDNLIFTSKNAAKQIINYHKELQNKQVFCVGSKTKKYLEKKGFEVVIMRSNANELANVIVEEFQKKNFTFFCGSIRKNTLPKTLHDNRVSFNEIVVYKTILSPKKITIPNDAILFFSPSGVESYLTNNSIENQICFCIGSTTAEPLNKVTNSIIITKKPTIEKVVKKCIKYYKKIK